MSSPFLICFFSYCTLFLFPRNDFGVTFLASAAAIIIIKKGFQKRSVGGEGSVGLVKNGRQTFTTMLPPPLPPISACPRGASASCAPPASATRERSSRETTRALFCSSTQSCFYVFSFVADLMSTFSRAFSAGRGLRSAVHTLGTFRRDVCRAASSSVVLADGLRVCVSLVFSSF